MENFKITEWSRFEHILFVLTVGAFSLSINLLIGSDEYFIFPFLLIASWILLFLSIVIHLFSFILANSFVTKYIKNLNEWAKRSFPVVDPNNFFGQKMDKGMQRVDILNFLTFLFIILGLTCLVAFASINFLNNNSIKKDMDKQTVKIIKHTKNGKACTVSSTPIISRPTDSKNTPEETDANQSAPGSTEEK